MYEFIAEPRVLRGIKDVFQPIDEQRNAGHLPNVRMIGQPNVHFLTNAEVQRHDVRPKRDRVGRQHPYADAMFDGIEMRGTGVGPQRDHSFDALKTNQLFKKAFRYLRTDLVDNPMARKIGFRLRRAENLQVFWCCEWIDMNAAEFHYLQIGACRPDELYR